MSVSPIKAVSPPSPIKVGTPPPAAQEGSPSNKKGSPNVVKGNFTSGLAAELAAERIKESAKPTARNSESPVSQSGSPRGRLRVARNLNGHSPALSSRAAPANFSSLPPPTAHTPTVVTTSVHAAAASALNVKTNG
jgi:hypothetical protein